MRPVKECFTLQLTLVLLVDKSFNFGPFKNQVKSASSANSSIVNFIKKEKAIRISYLDVFNYSVTFNSI